MSASTSRHLSPIARGRRAGLAVLALAAVALGGFAPVGQAEAATTRVTALTPHQTPAAAKAHPSAAAAALNYAEWALGAPYRYGGTSAFSGFDCSGLTSTAYAFAGVAIPRTARAQFAALPHVALAQVRPGDLVFWATNVNNPATIYHVAIFAGNGMIIAAPHTGTVVQIKRLSATNLVRLAARPSPSGSRAMLPVSPVNRGDAIVAVQRRLRSIGFTNVPLTGTWNAQTAGAVGWIHRNFRIAEGNAVGPRTWGLLVTHGALNR